MRARVGLAMVLLGLGASCKDSGERASPEQASASSERARAEPSRDADERGPTQGAAANPGARGHTPEQVCEHLRAHRSVPAQDDEDERRRCIADFEELATATNWGEISGCLLDARTTAGILQCQAIIPLHDPPGVADDDPLRRACDRLVKLTNAKAKQLAKDFEVSPAVFRTQSNGCVSEILEDRDKYRAAAFEPMLECMADAESLDEIGDCEDLAR